MAGEHRDRSRRGDGGRAVHSAPVRLATAALMFLVLAPAASADTLTVESGDLQARVETDPWSLSFVDARGNPVAAESSGMRLGFRTQSGWAGATRAVSAARDGAAVMAELETAVAGPLGPMPGDRLRVRVAPGGPGNV